MFEMLSGQRMMTSYIRPGGLWRDIVPEFEPALRDFLNYFPAKVDDYERILTENPLWIDRTQGIGFISAEDAIRYGCSGPVLRGSGVNWDIRKAIPYSSYDHFEFDVPLGQHGGVSPHCAYLEMRQSSHHPAGDRQPVADRSALRTASTACRRALSLGT